MRKCRIGTAKFFTLLLLLYRTSANIGGMKNEIFLSAFKELSFMGPIAFILDFFIIGHIAKKLAFKIVNPAKDNPFFLVLAISAISVVFMCPLMSLAATLIFKNAGVEVISVWLETTALNFPMALCWQLFFAGPIVRFIFRHIFRRSLTADNTH